MTGQEFQQQHPGAPMFRLPFALVDSHDEVVLLVREGGAETANGRACCTIEQPFGDWIGGRNTQGGRLTGRAQDLNYDLGAGDSVNRGVVGVCPDVGKGTVLGSGRNRAVARFIGSDDPAKDYARVHARLMLDQPYLLVRRGDGTWRKVGL